MSNNIRGGALSEILRGAKASLPIVLGFIPVGIAYAIMAASAGFNEAETIFMSVFVFAGASEMMAVGMYKQGALIAAIIFATFMMNLRHVIMSTCVFKKTEKQSIIKRMFLGFFVTDESFAVITSEKEKCGFCFFASLAVTHYLAWIVGSAIGAFAATLLPAQLSVSLGISLYAMFIGLLIPSVKNNPRLLVLVLCTAMLNGVLSLFIDGAFSLIISTLLGAFVGVYFVDLDPPKNKNDETLDPEKALDGAEVDA